MTTATGRPLIKWTELYENRSQRTGEPYLVGALAGLKIIIMKNPDAERGQPQWTLYVSARPERVEKKEPSA